METGDVIAIVVATVVALLSGVLVAALVALVRTLRELRAALESMREETVALLDAVSETVREAAVEVDRVDRLVTSAERITGSAERLEGAVDSASRLAYRTLASPVVKAMAFGTGVTRAAPRLREGEHPSPAPAVARRRRARGRKAS